MQTDHGMSGAAVFLKLFAAAFVTLFCLLLVGFGALMMVAENTDLEGYAFATARVLNVESPPGGAVGLGDGLQLTVRYDAGEGDLGGLVTMPYEEVLDLGRNPQPGDLIGVRYLESDPSALELGVRPFDAFRRAGVFLLVSIGSLALMLWFGAIRSIRHRALGPLVEQYRLVRDGERIALRERRSNPAGALVFSFLAGLVAFVVLAASVGRSGGLPPSPEQMQLAVLLVGGITVLGAVGLALLALLLPNKPDVVVVDRAKCELVLPASRGAATTVPLTSITKISCSRTGEKDLKLGKVPMLGVFVHWATETGLERQALVREVVADQSARSPEAGGLLRWLGGVLGVPTESQGEDRRAA